MKFVKLHQSGREILVNMSTVTDIYMIDNKCQLFLNLAVDGDQAHLKVDESLDEIYEKVKESENE